MDFKKVLIRLSCVIALLGIVKCSDAQSLFVIGNDIGMKEIKMGYLKEVYQAKYTFWPNKKSVQIALPGTQSEDAVFVYSQVYGKSVKDVQKFWLSIVFQGRAKSPNFFDTSKEMVEYVQRTPGAIGLLKSDAGVPKNMIIKLIP
jgi:hypothetical protein